MSEATLAQIIEKFHTLGSETAYVHRRGYRVQRWSYRQVAEFARRLANELAERGIGPGDSCILWGHDCAEWAVSFFGCILRGVIVVPMDRAASLDFVRRVSRQVNARLCICSRELPPIDPSMPVLILESLSECVSRHSPEVLSSPELRTQDTVEIVFTSGATADPKGVILTHKNILTNLEFLKREIDKYRKYERMVHPLRFLNLLPLSHVFGQFMALFIPQILGSTVVFIDTLNPSEILRTVKRERVSVLVSVPRTLDMIRSKIERDLESKGALDRFREDLQKAAGEHFLRRWWRFRDIHRQFCWKFWAFISGGATLSAASERFWGMLGFAVIQGYGLTETTSLISINHPFRLEKGSIGRILPGREVRLAPDGEILVRGDSIAAGYYRGSGVERVSKEDNDDKDEGWFHTGDLGAVDEKGNLYFKGRLKNVLVGPEGTNIYPEDLEAALRAQPEVRDCVVLGLNRAGNAEPCAVLVLRGEVDPGLVIQRANTALAEFQRLHHWFIWPEQDFPRTSTLKPKIHVIRDFIDAMVKGSAATATAEARGRTLSDLIARTTGRTADTVAADTNLAGDLDLSSLERVELLSALEDRFHVDLDESIFTAARTVNDLQKMLSSSIRQQTHFGLPRWAQTAPAEIIRSLAYWLLIRPAMFLLCNPRVRGQKHVRKIGGPVLFVANHVTQVDVAFVLAALPRRFRRRLAVAMMGEMLEGMRNPPPGVRFMKRWMDKFSYFLAVTWFNSFPLPQQAGLRESFAFAGESADRGYSILVFPEGMRTRDGKMNPFRAGIGLLATNLGLPVVPIRIDGLFELKSAGKVIARPGTVSVRLGPPVSYDPGTDPSKIAADLERRVHRMAEAPNTHGNGEENHVLSL